MELWQKIVAGIVVIAVLVGIGFGIKAGVNKVSSRTTTKSSTSLPTAAQAQGTTMPAAPAPTSTAVPSTMLPVATLVPVSTAPLTTPSPTPSTTVPPTTVPPTTKPPTTAPPTTTPMLSTTIRQVDRPDFCLTHVAAGNYGIKSRQCVPGDRAQQWYHDPTVPTVRPGSDPNVCLTALGATGATAAAACNGSAAQKWSFTPAGAMVPAAFPASSLQVGSGGTAPEWINTWQPIASGAGALWKRQ